jgi:periplasmic protein TonB
MRRFALISVGLHAALLAGLLLWFRHEPSAPDTPEKEGAVELVLLEQKGTGDTTAPAAPTPDVPAPPAPVAAPPAPAPPDTAETEEPLPLPPPPPPVPPSSAKPSPPRQQPAAPPVQRAQEAPVINLGGNDAETDAIVSGPHVIPAGMDARFHNQEPAYPPEAVRRAQQGAVILLIHVSPVGLASGVDVFRSSGFSLLDRAARDAVEGWHFLPAVKDGVPIPFDMTLRVVFRLE